MIDIKDLENEYRLYQESMQKRQKSDEDLEAALSLYEEKKILLESVDSLRAKRNQLTKEYHLNMTDDLKQEVTDLKHELLEKESDLKLIDTNLENLLLNIPNILDISVPSGANEDDNLVVKAWRDPYEFDFKVQAHDDIGAALDILDIPRGIKLSGSRFYTLKNEGAALERALANFFLDEAIAAGFEEIFAPFLVNDNALKGTGQLPKFKDDLFKIEGQELYLIPTAEVSITNLYSKEILKKEILPAYFCGYSSCFRKEAGSYGKDTKGIFRVHQFQKVEVVKYSLPEKSMDELEHLVSFSESLLEKLALPYRRVLLCGGDTGFSSSKTYDLEVYLPYEKRYREISSCSNFGSFQARRASIKYKDDDGRNHFVHTLNGSALAIGRTFIAILENYQTKTGTVRIPDVLVPYMRGKKEIVHRSDHAK